MNKARVIIAGSRDFDNYNLLKENIENILKDYEDIEIISGTAKGADSLGEKYAIENDIKLKQFPAQWNLYGKQAGYIRNKQMAKYSIEDNSIGILIAFWDGASKGTGHMINIANEMNLQVHIVKF